ncbi:MAG: XkdF-like putative serine protease domain-containing protein [Erysipelotrichaceae bacterium]
MRPKKTTIPIIKQANEELKQATFLVLAPDEVDLHGDIYDANEVRKACHNFNTHCRKANLLHLFDTETFSIAESYIAPVEMQMGETIIKAGSWVSVLQFHNDDIWNDVKDENFTGVSIGGTATVIDLED